MRSQTSTILIVCFAIVMPNNFGMSVEVSSMVDLDSDESEETPGSTTLGIIISPMDQGEAADPSESVLRAPTSIVIGRRRGSGLVKATEPRKRRIYPSHVSVLCHGEIITLHIRN